MAARQTQSTRTVGGRKRSTKKRAVRKAQPRPTAVKKSARKKSKSKPAPKPSRITPPNEGCRADVRISERTSRERDDVAGKCEIVTAIGGNGRGVGRVHGVSKAAMKLARWKHGVCRALGAAGHVQRGAILLKLLEGPATYRALQRVTKLKAGPLYHHVNQLRLAGLLLPKQRDLYELTRGGRNLILSVSALGKLINDRRRRPV